MYICIYCKIFNARERVAIFALVIFREVGNQFVCFSRGSSSSGNNGRVYISVYNNERASAHDYSFSITGFLAAR